jgi:hypothetical protein
MVRYVVGEEIGSAAISCWNASGDTLQRARERGSATEGGLGTRGCWDGRGKGLSGAEFPSVED